MKAASPRKIDYVLLVVTATLLAVGLILVFSSSYATAQADTGDALYYLKRQLIWAVIGLGALWLGMRIDYRYWRRWALPGYFVGIVLLVAVLVVGRDVLGAKRWIDLGFLRLQPSEPAKVLVINLLAALIAARKSQMQAFWEGFVATLVPVALVCGLIMLEPDLGTTLALLGTATLMLFAAGAPVLHLGLLVAAAIPAGVAMIVLEPYRIRRLMAFINPWADPRDSGWNIIQSLLAIGSGGLFGLGLGESRQKFSYLPEQQTDFIFAILAEELGFLGSALVLTLFVLLAWRGYRAALKAPDLYGCMLATGLTTMIVLQAAMNIGVVSAVLPATGITLPLISFGGSSLSVTLAAIGVLLNISAAGNRLPAEAES